MFLNNLYKIIAQARNKILQLSYKAAERQNVLVQTVNVFKKVTLIFMLTGIVTMFAKTFLPKTFENITDSVSKGTYIEIRDDTIQINDIVAFPVGRIEFPFGSKPDYFLKIVGGLPDDYLSITNEAIKINETVLVLDPFPKTDYQLNPFYYSGKIPPDYAFVYTAYGNSYDSRYFGFIPIQQLIKVKMKEEK